METILVTGVAGFIGFHLCQALLQAGKQVIGIDNLNSYYDVNLKRNRLHQLKQYSQFQFVKLDLGDCENIMQLFQQYQFERVVNLAAQAGVRYSLSHPEAYVDSNINGFLNILEGCRHHGVQHLVYASSSSVYGLNTQMPFSTHQGVDHPISFYAATKRANELMAHTYSHLYGLPTTGLRFFSVYGPWGRPDMALFIFTKTILAGQPINVFNQGKMKRNFTYIDDVVAGIMGVLDLIPQPRPNWSSLTPDPANSAAPYQLYNVGNNHPVELLHFIQVLEQSLGVVAQKNWLPMQPGDVPTTFADISDLQRVIGFNPKTSIKEGIPQFVAWYRSYFNC